VTLSPPVDVPIFNSLLQLLAVCLLVLVSFLFCCRNRVGGLGGYTEFESWMVVFLCLEVGSMAFLEGIGGRRL
jgi:hypothetical protein